MKSETSIKKYLITSALPYVNNVPHLGNIIGSTLSADVYARYLRKDNKEVMYVCGTDEYGTTTEVKALSENMTCEEICAKYRKIHKEVYGWFNISFDIFGQTTTETQTDLAQEIFIKLYKNKLLVEKEVDQLWCEKCKRYVSDRYIFGKCYISGCSGITKGDQCEKCCHLIDINKLTEKYCSVCNSIPVSKKSKHLYLKMNAFREILKVYFLDDNISKELSYHIKYISPSAHSITKGWLDGVNGNKELEDRCITRDLKWGTPVPKVAGLEEYWNKVFYVWFDAPIGYLSILKHALKDEWINWIKTKENDVNWIQFMAKDNVPFHSVIFPITLLGSNYETPLVTHMSSTDYLTAEGNKFSKSNNTGIFGDKVIEISKKIGIDEDYWRYYLIKIRPENGDSDFRIVDFCTIIKGELAQKIGNLINRTLMLSKKIYKNEDENTQILKYDFSKHDVTKELLLKTFDNYIKSFEKFEYHDVIRNVNKIAEIGNEWFDSQKLWSSCGKDKPENDYLMGNEGFIIWLLAELMEPVMPNKCKKIKHHFNNLIKTTYCYADIKKSLLENIGEIKFDWSEIELLFKQVKPEEFK